MLASRMRKRTIDKPPRNIQVNRRSSMRTILAIKLIRTDTTHDLSQKAEKGMKKTTGRGLSPVLGQIQVTQSLRPLVGRGIHT